MIRIGLSYILSVVVAFTFSSAFYTQQVIAGHMEIGAVYTAGQQVDAYLKNFIGLAPAFGIVLAIALAIGFFVAAYVRRFLQPLARIVFPLAGAAAVTITILLIEYTAGAGGVGAIGGASDATGLALQSLAGFIGGVVFAVTRGAAPTNR